MKLNISSKRVRVGVGCLHCKTKGGGKETAKNNKLTNRVRKRERQTQKVVSEYN